MIGKIIYYALITYQYLMRVISTELATSYYRITCAKFGANSKVRWGTWIRYPFNVSIGDNVFIDSGVSIGSEVKSSTLRIDSDVQINANVGIDYTGGLIIGENTLISAQSIIYSHSHGLDPRSQPVPIPKCIGASCWIGIRSVILEGVSEIAPHSIIGAGSVLTKSVKEAGIYAGVPAKLIRALPKQSLMGEDANKVISAER